MKAAARYDEPFCSMPSSAAVLSDAVRGYWLYVMLNKAWQALESNKTKGKNKPEKTPRHPLL
jgi:hypothetical protein